MDSYRDATRPIADRVADLLSRMTLREKAGQMNQKMLGWQALERRAGRLEPTRAFEEEVALGDGLGALYGLFRADPWSGVNFANGLSVEEGPGAANRLQRYVLGKTRLGIPLLFSEECPHGHQALDASIFPTSLAVGCTWNPELYRRAYEKAAAQMRARGATLALVSLPGHRAGSALGALRGVLRGRSLFGGAVRRGGGAGLQGRGRRRCVLPSTWPWLPSISAPRARPSAGTTVSTPSSERESCGRFICRPWSRLFAQVYKAAWRRITILTGCTATPTAGC